MQGWTIHKRRAYLIDIRYFITDEETFFIDNKLFCSINIDSSTVLILKNNTYVQALLKSISYVDFFISEGSVKNEGMGIHLELKSLSHSNNALLLDYLSVGGVNVKIGVSTMFERGVIFTTHNNQKGACSLLITKMAF